MFHVQTEKGPPCQTSYGSLTRASNPEVFACFQSDIYRLCWTILYQAGKRRNHYKRYLCLFTCLGMRAVHLEVAYMALTPTLFSQHGLPKDVLLDNGTNFVGANNELEELAGLEREMIQEKTACYGAKWHFNPPLAPHFNGVHEVMINKKLPKRPSMPS